MSTTSRTQARDERTERSPWSTEPELPPDPSRAYADPGFDARRALTELELATRRTVDELTVELETLRPLLVVDPNAESQYSSALRRLAAAEQTELDVRSALTRLDDGSYGFCVACTEPIPAERLELLPHAHSCVPCS
jgi:RNA polymerase-binding transcription factor DksA